MEKKQKSFTGPKCQDCGKWNFAPRQPQGAPRATSQPIGGPAVENLLKLILGEIQQIKAKLPSGQQGSMKVVPEYSTMDFVPEYRTEETVS